VLTSFIYSILSYSHVEIKGKHREITESRQSAFFTQHTKSVLWAIVIKITSWYLKQRMITDISLDVAQRQSPYPPDVDGWRWFWRPLWWIVWLWNHNVVKLNRDFVPLTHTLADVMLVLQLLVGMFSLAAIYGYLTEVTAQEVLLMLTAATAGDREPLSGGRFSL